MPLLYRLGQLLNFDVSYKCKTPLLGLQRQTLANTRVSGWPQGQLLANKCGHGLYFSPLLFGTVCQLWLHHRRCYRAHARAPRAAYIRGMPHLQVTVLVNNAGVATGFGKSPHRRQPDEWDTMLAVIWLRQCASCACLGPAWPRRAMASSSTSPPWPASTPSRSLSATLAQNGA